MLGFEYCLDDDALLKLLLFDEINLCLLFLFIFSLLIELFC